MMQSRSGECLVAQCWQHVAHHPAGTFLQASCRRSVIALRSTSQYICTEVKC